MKADLESLMVSREELQAINPAAAQFVPTKAAIAIGCSILFFSVLGVLVWGWQLWLRRNRSLVKLVAELNHYHQVIQNIDVVDQLQEAGNPIVLSNRNQVIKALQRTRNDLIRAFKTEQILRSNPQFKPDCLSTNLTTSINLAIPTALEISECAIEYGQVFDQLLTFELSDRELL